MRTTIQEHYPLLLIFLCAFFVRALFLPFFVDAYFDSGRMMSQYELASNIADGHGFVHNQSFLSNAVRYNSINRRNTDFKVLQRTVTWNRDAVKTSPDIDDAWGYAFLLGQIWRVTNDKSYLYLQVFQMILDSIACVMLFASVLMLFGNKRYAYAASLAYLCFVPFIFMTDIANRDYYAAWGLIYSLFFFLLALGKSKRAPYFLCSGLAVALFSWFRPTIFLIAFVYGFYFWLKEAPTLRGILTTARAWALMMLFPLLLFILPFSLLYHHRYDTYNFASLNGAALWEGLGEIQNSYGFRCSDSAAYERAWQLGYPRNETGLSAEFGRLLREDAVRVIRRDPLFYLNACSRRYVRFVFLNVPLGLSERFQLSYRAMGMSAGDFITKYPQIAVEKAVKLILRFALPLLAVLALWVLRAYLREVLLLLLIWQYKIFVHVATHLEERYVMEGYFPVVVLAALVVVVLWEAGRRRARLPGSARYAGSGPPA